MLEKNDILYIIIGAGKTTDISLDTEIEIARIPVTGNTSFNTAYTRIWVGAVGGGGCHGGFVVMQNTDFISIYIKPHYSSAGYVAPWFSSHFSIPLDSTYRIQEEN